MKLSFGFIFCVLLSNISYGHARWIKPSHTILSAEKAEYVSFDVSISNDIFHPDISIGGVALSDISKPDGNRDNQGNKKLEKIFGRIELMALPPESKDTIKLPMINLGRKSTSAMKIEQSGTYKVFIDQPEIAFTHFKNKNGKPGRLFGRASQLKDKIPEGAIHIETSLYKPRLETFVTKNAISDINSASSDKGLRFEYLTHPNELFVGESLTLRVLLNGEKVAHTGEIKVTRNGTRYRNARETRTLVPNEQGEVHILWEQAGMYLIDAEVVVPSAEPGVKSEIYALFAVLEVNPE